MITQNLRWLKGVGLKELEKPFEHKQTGASFPYLLVMPDKTEMYYTEEYLEKTPLKELQRGAEFFGVIP